MCPSSSMSSGRGREECTLAERGDHDFGRWFIGIPIDLLWVAFDLQAIHEVLVWSIPNGERIDVKHHFLSFYTHERFLLSQYGSLRMSITLHPFLGYLHATHSLVFHRTNRTTRSPNPTYSVLFPEKCAFWHSYLWCYRYWSSVKRKPCWGPISILERALNQRTLI